MPLTGFSNVKYGLTVPASRGGGASGAGRPPPRPPAAAPNALFAAADEEGEEGVEEELARARARRARAGRDEAAWAAALAEDPSVFDYDGAAAADEAAGRGHGAQRAAAMQRPRESRYIAALKEQTVRRERDDDGVRERRYARERRAEEKAGLYTDKETFITGAYKEELAAREEARAEEEARERAEASKGYDRTAFLRNLATGGAAAAAARPEEAPRTAGGAAGGGDRQQQGLPQQPVADAARQGEAPSSAEAAAEQQQPAADAMQEDEVAPPPLTLEEMAAALEAKVTEARERYLERKRARLKAGVTF